MFSSFLGKFPFTFICGFVCFSLCGHYLKVCGPTHLRLVAGRVSAIHDLTPDLMLVWGLGKLLMSHILCGRFWVRILYDDKINLPKSQGRSPTLISVAIILYPNNTMTYYVVWYFYHLIGTTYDFISVLKLWCWYQKKTYMYIGKEREAKERSQKPRGVNWYLWAIWRSTAFHSSIGRRLWRCLDSFDCTSRVTFECLHFDECSTMEISGKESSVVEKIFFSMIIANFIRGLWSYMWMS